MPRSAKKEFLRKIWTTEPVLTIDGGKSTAFKASKTIVQVSFQVKSVKGQNVKNARDSVFGETLTSKPILKIYFNAFCLAGRVLS